MSIESLDDEGVCGESYDHDLMELDAVGRCLNCGGRGGFPGPGDDEVLACSRCEASGLDPARDEAWYQRIVAPIQEGS